MIEKLLPFILGGGLAATVTWIISLRTQVRRLKNDAINSDSDTTEKSLAVSTKLIHTNAALQEKIGVMMDQVASLTNELREVKEELLRSSAQLLAFSHECTCGAAAKHGLQNINQK